MEDNSRLRKYFVIAIILDLLIVAGIVALAFQKNKKEAILNVNITPSNAVVKIGEEEYGNGVFELSPQKVTATISAEGFKTETMELSLEEESITEISKYLEPESPHYWAEHMNEAVMLESMNSEEAKRIYAILDLKNSLPLTNYKYRGRYEASEETTIVEKTSDCDAILCLFVKSNAVDGLEKAKALIKEKGFNPDDYEIEYETF